MKSPQVARWAVGLMAAASLAGTDPNVDFSPDVASAMDEEKAALAEAHQVTRTGERGDPLGELRFGAGRHRECLKAITGMETTYGKFLSGDPAAKSCWLEWTQTRTQTLRLAIQAAKADKAGVVPAELMTAMRNPTRQPFGPTRVDPLSGTNAKIEHKGAAATLTYTDAGGAHHEYAVARPKFAQGIIQGDAGGWMYLAPDHKSGIMFTMGVNSQVTGKPANPMMLQMMGQ